MPLLSLGLKIRRDNFDSTGCRTSRTEQQLQEGRSEDYERGFQVGFAIHHVDVEVLERIKSIRWKPSVLILLLLEIAETGGWRTP